MFIALNNEQKQILDEVLSRELRKKQKRFKKKGLSHFNNPKLKAIYEKYQVEYSPLLYEIPFKCYFSFYLYLILKSKVKFMDWMDCPPHYRIAISQDFNVTQLHRETGICNTIIRRAFRELVKFRMVEITDYCKPEHKSCKSILVLNDYYIHSYCNELGYVTYSSELPFNFYNNPKYKKNETER